jgi:hypothetical protein
MFTIGAKHAELSNLGRRGTLFFVSNEFPPGPRPRHPNCVSDRRLNHLLKTRIPKPEVRSARVPGSGTVDTGTPLISTAKFPFGVIQAPLFVQVWNTPPLRSANPSDSSDEIGGPGLTANGT